MDFDDVAVAREKRPLNPSGGPGNAIDLSNLILLLLLQLVQQQ